MLVKNMIDTTEPFPTIKSDDTVQQAARLMRGADVRAVPVVENGRLVGIITDWDVVDSFAQRAHELSDMPVSAVMTSENLITIGPEATVAEATDVLGRHRVHHLPVIDGDKYVGTLCLGLEWSEEGMLTPPVRPTLTARHP